MGQYRVHREAVQRSFYVSSLCSLAALLQLVLLVFLIAIPYLAAYRSQGFWIRTDSYTEQPEVAFKNQLLLVAQGTGPDGADAVFTWSSFANYNRLVEAHLRPPAIKSREIDSNRDGVKDELRLELSLPLAPGEAINSVQLLLLFDYRLHEYVELQMESAGYFQLTSPISAADLSVDAVLAFRQEEALQHSGTRTLFNTPVVDGSSVLPQAYDLTEVLDAYLGRNETTVLDDLHSVWKGPRAAQPFTLRLTVRYPIEQILFRPGFWQEVKWAWIQYLAFLVIFLFFVRLFQGFVFNNQVVGTAVRLPYDVVAAAKKAS